MLDHHRAQLLRCHMPESRVRGVVVKCRDGESTGRAVINALKDQSCDAVCLGTRGLGALQGALLGVMGLGSVGDFVVHNSKVPVTVVPHTTPVPEMITVATHRDLGGA